MKLKAHYLPFGWRGQISWRFFFSRKHRNIAVRFSKDGYMRVITGDIFYYCYSFCINYGRICTHYKGSRHSKVFCSLVPFMILSRVYKMYHNHSVKLQPNHEISTLNFASSFNGCNVISNYRSYYLLLFDVYSWKTVALCIRLPISYAHIVPPSPTLRKVRGSYPALRKFLCRAPARQSRRKIFNGFQMSKAWRSCRILYALGTVAVTERIYLRRNFVSALISQIPSNSWRANRDSWNITPYTVYPNVVYRN